jgi:hypothetical protein
MACSKCGKPLVKEDRGNITLGIPDGFDHVDCDKSKYLGRDMSIPDPIKEETPYVLPEKVEEKPTLDSAPVMEQKEERVYPKPIKRGGRDSIFKKRLS